MKHKRVLNAVLYILTAPAVLAMFFGMLLPIFILKFPRRFMLLKSAGYRWHDGNWQEPGELIFWN